MHEGYVHAYHGLPVQRRHKPLRDRLWAEKEPETRHLAATHPDRLPPPRFTRLWAYLFETGKRFGRRRARARLAAGERRP
jgi:hypothetical protein